MGQMHGSPPPPTAEEVRGYNAAAALDPIFTPIAGTGVGFPHLSHAQLQRRLKVYRAMQCYAAPCIIPSLSPPPSPATALISHTHTAKLLHGPGLPPALY